MENILDSDIRSDFFKLNRWLLKNNKELFDKLVYYNDIYNRLNIAVFVHDLTRLRHIWANNCYEKITGYSKEEIMQMGPEWAEENYHPEDRFIMKERIKYFREKSGDSYSCIYRIKHKENRWVWLYSNCVVFNRDRYGMPVQLLGIAIDFTGSFKTIGQLEKLILENKMLRNELILCKISKREKEVLTFISRGLSAGQIGSQLNISPNTVNNHRKNMMKKLGAGNIAQLIKIVEENGF
ncbi:MAG: PAS domain-containing protein [Bacteroidales bacterium]|nr:PAS domain-containing protein [Bacteroidales bacterium]